MQELFYDYSDRLRDRGSEIVGASEWQAFRAGEPTEVTLAPLQPDTRYYYP
jgi:hypothetical protein